MVLIMVTNLNLSVAGPHDDVTYLDLSAVGPQDDVTYSNLSTASPQLDDVTYLNLSAVGLQDDVTKLLVHEQTVCVLGLMTAALEILYVFVDWALLPQRSPRHLPVMLPAPPLHTTMQNTRFGPQVLRVCMTT